MIKLCIKLCMRTLLRLMYPFWKVKNNQIVFESYGGKQISCNPYYIWQELQRQHPEWKYIWIYDGNNLPINCFNCINKKNLKVYIQAMMTSKVIIANQSVSCYIPFRKSQLIINTWHGGGAYKKVGLDLKFNRTIERKICYKLNNKDCSYFISSNQKFADIMSKAYTIDKSKFLPIGLPRNDIFFDKTKIQDANEKVRKAYSISKDDFIVLYAPTFRSYDDSQFKTSLPISLLTTMINHRFKKECKVLVRNHHILKTVNFESNAEAVLDVSVYQDMQELLCAADMLISDYSSCIWDYSFLYRPCILFIPDVSSYIQNQDFYVPIETWGFPIADSPERLSAIIQTFEEKEFVKQVKKHHADLGSYEHGIATGSICHLIETEGLHK